MLSKKSFVLLAMPCTEPEGKSLVFNITSDAPFILSEFSRIVFSLLSRSQGGRV